jgi:uncharacterized membrane protein
MLHLIHEAGHKYLKVLFLLACAGSSTLFFAGAALPTPPTPVVLGVSIALGLAVEWGYCTFSCDLTEAITEGNRGGILLNLLYTLIGGAASWFLFTNAAISLHWAPRSPLVGLDQKTWAMLMAALVVLIIFALSARRERVKDQADLQSMARAVTVMLPHASSSTRLQLLSAIAAEAAKQGERQGTAPGRGISGPSTRALPPAEQTGKEQPEAEEGNGEQPGWFRRGWQRLTGGKPEAEAQDEG